MNGGAYFSSLVNMINGEGYGMLLKGKDAITIRDSYEATDYTIYNSDFGLER